MEAARADGTEKYRKYIQKRRIAKDADEGSPGAAAADTALPDSLRPDGTGFFARPAENPYPKSIEGTVQYGVFGQDADTKSRYASAETYTREYPGRNVTPFRRTDAGLYRTLYGNKKKTHSYTGGTYRPYSGATAEIEDNRTTILAVKLIKQALACFAILGLIVLMQGRSDMTEVLATIRHQVLEINFEPKSIYEGLQGFITECSRVLGGSP